MTPGDMAPKKQGQSSGHSLRALAAIVGVSHATVSAALRGSPCVKPETTKRIVEAATKMGYHVNPLASAMMAEMRRSRNGVFRGTVATLDVQEGDRPPYSIPYHRELVRGAKTRAAELGFKIKMITVGPTGTRMEDMNALLQSEGIHGVLALPTWNEPNFSWLDWTKFAGVYADYIIQRPPLDSVCPDHYRSMMTVLQRLEALGYRRAGLFLPTRLDARITHQWEAALLGFQTHAPSFSRVPTLTSPALTEVEFKAWFNRHKPDVVIGHATEAIGWMKSIDAKVPETHGFVSLNLLVKTVPCAGLDLQPQLIGARAVEMLISLLHRNERGIPSSPATTTIPSRWIEGPTLRQQ